MVNRTRALTFAILLLAGGALQTSAAEGPLLPLNYLTVKDEQGQVRATAVVLQQLETETAPSAALLLIMTEQGDRAELTATFDPKRGVATSILTDLSSGWWFELERDFGMPNMGEVDDHASTSDWLAANLDRLREQKPPSTYTLRSVGGFTSQWVKRWKQPEEEERGEESTTASLAAQMAERQVPDSLLSTAAVLAFLMRSDSQVRLSEYLKLSQVVGRAVSAATGGAELAVGDGTAVTLVVADPAQHRSEVGELVGERKLVEVPAAGD
jgi:hypothetical protein